MNPMLAALNRTQAQPAMLNQISQLQSLAATIRNPVGAIQSTAMAQLQSHPLYQQAKQIADQYGGDWNRAFEETAKKNGIDPNQIRTLMRQQGLVSG